jgi:hypothetical protein
MTGQGQAEVGIPDQSANRTEWQAEVNNPVRCDKVQNCRQAQGQGRQNGQNRGKLETDRSERKTLVGLTNKTNWQQTKDIGINTLGIMGKMGDTRRWVETSTKTGETDQGVTENSSSP